MNSGATISMDRGSIVKAAKYNELKEQVHVYQQVHALSKTSNLFITPRLLGYGMEDGSMEFEHLPAFQSLVECLDTAPRQRLLIEQVARSLAFVHRYGQLDSEYIRYAPGTWRGCRNHCVLIHGDFNLINVGYDSQQNRVVILDWEVTPALNIYFNMGTRYIDISYFLRSLLLQQQSLCQAAFEFSQQATWFLDAYQDACDLQLSMGALWYYLNLLGQATQKKQWAQHKWLSLGQNISGKMMLSYFIKMYKTHSLVMSNDGKGDAQCKS
jgi:hypothetical protein